MSEINGPYLTSDTILFVPTDREGNGILYVIARDTFNGDKRLSFDSTALGASSFSAAKTRIESDATKPIAPFVAS